MKGILPGPAVGSLRMTQITRNQHYVPKFYFERFAKEEQIQVYRDLLSIGLHWLPRQSRYLDL